MCFEGKSKEHQKWRERYNNQIIRREELIAVVPKKKFQARRGIDITLLQFISGRMDKRKSKGAKERVSKLMKGRTPWNKGVGLEHSSIRKGIETRKCFARLRKLQCQKFILQEKDRKHSMSL